MQNMHSAQKDINLTDIDKNTLSDLKTVFCKSFEKNSGIGTIEKVSADRAM